MAEIVANWEPIFTGISTTVQLAKKLFDQVETHRENKPLAEGILGKLVFMEKKLEEWSKGSQVTDLHSEMRESLLREIDDANEELEKFTWNISCGEIRQRAIQSIRRRYSVLC